MAAVSLPSTMVGLSAGIGLRDFLIANPAAQMTVNFPAVRITDPSFSDVLNASSLRGPNNSFDVTKPDITGPGTNIYAAVSDAAGQFGFLTGTSMSSPHLAGSGALVRAAHPTLTPARGQERAAIDCLAQWLEADRPDPADADDVGNGRVNVGAAVRTGLVMNETFANFLCRQSGHRWPAA